MGGKRQKLSNDLSKDLLSSLNVDLEVLLDHLREAIIALNQENRIIFWNKRAESLYGWAKKDVLGKMAGMIIPSSRCFSKFQSALEETKSRGKWYGELVQKTKKSNEILVSGDWVYIDQGPKSIILMSNIDSTEKSKKEALNTRIQRTRNISALVDAVAHDLNNVLSPALMATSIFRRKFPDSETELLVDSLESSLRHGAEMIRQVKTFSKGLKGQSVPIVLHRLIHELEKGLSINFPQSIKIQVDIKENLGVVLGDESQVYQVLYNICINGRDAMPSGGTLSISAKNVKVEKKEAASIRNGQAGSFVLIEIADTGSGISPEIQERIFDPFFTTKESSRATGIGLSTSLGIIKAHEGFLDFHTDMEKGSIFKIYIPITSPERIKKAEASSQSLPKGKGESILVVDDESSNLVITATTLKDYGYKVKTAKDGTEAVAQYAQHKKLINVVLIDMKMPVMDGQLTIRALQKMNPDVKIIANSGTNDYKKTMETQNLGIKGFLYKPYTAEELLTTIDRVLK